MAEYIAQLGKFIAFLYQLDIPGIGISYLQMIFLCITLSTVGILIKGGSDKGE